MKLAQWFRRWNPRFKVGDVVCSDRVIGTVIQRRGRRYLVKLYNGTAWRDEGDLYV